MFNHPKTRAHMQIPVARLCAPRNDEMRSTFSCPPDHQRGAVLVVGLVMLVVVVMLGLVSMRSVALQERLAGGFASQNLALQSAETALQAAERIIQGGGAPKEADMAENPGWFSMRGSSTIQLPASPLPDEAAFWNAETYSKLSQEVKAVYGVPSVDAGDTVIDYYGPTKGVPGGFARFTVNRQEDVPINPADVLIGEAPVMVPLRHIYSYGRGVTSGVWAGVQSEHKQK
ncbi:MAG: hypothetical protein LBR88_08130 [Zoogloeaceae bacterium]|jgi:hypothetical protein|nr:hypothetical protein [Zoogloeaceae bacterium]